MCQLGFALDVIFIPSSTPRRYPRLQVDVFSVYLSCYSYHLQAALAHAVTDRAAYVDLFLTWGASVQASTMACPTPIQTLIISGWANRSYICEEELGYIRLFIR